MFRRGPGSLYRKVRSIEYLLTRDRRAVLEFLLARYPIRIPLSRRVDLLRRYVRATNAVRGYHTQAEMLRIADRILRLAGRDGLCVVEAGAGKGCSTAKLSLAVSLAGGTLHVFDSFRGIPENSEHHRHVDGRSIVFRAGAFTGRLQSVRRTVERYGSADVCTFHKGWFVDTLPVFRQSIDLAVLDVDLLESTRTCIRHLFPLLRPGGCLFTQDGHLVSIIELLANPKFWMEEVGTPPPLIPGLGTEKLLEITPRPITT